LQWVQIPTRPSQLALKTLHEAGSVARDCSPNLLAPLPLHLYTSAYPCDRAVGSMGIVGDRRTESTGRTDPSRCKTRNITKNVRLKL
jgi:hypothetical protein